jgi:multiple sugar transport system substrate-binding protein
LTKQKDGETVWGTTWSWKRFEGLVCDWLLLAYAFPGTKIFDDEGRPVFNRGGGVQALQWMVDMLYKYKAANPASLTLEEEAVNQTFIAGKTAMICNWEGTLVQADDTMRSVIIGKARAALFPAVPPNVSATTLGPEGLAIMKNASRKHEAMIFLRFLMRPDIQKKIFLLGGYMPIYDYQFRDPELAQITKQLDMMGEQFRYAFNRPKLLNYNEVSDVLQLELHNALLRHKTPQQALDDAAAKIEGMLIEEGLLKDQSQRIQKPGVRIQKLVGSR